MAASAGTGWSAGADHRPQPARSAKRQTKLIAATVAFAATPEMKVISCSQGSGPGGGGCGGSIRMGPGAGAIEVFILLASQAARTLAKI
jgi:hypothetical protein